MAIAVVKLDDQFSAPAAAVVASSGRMRDSMGQFARQERSDSGSLQGAITKTSGKMTAFEKSCAKTGKQVSSLNFSGLTDFFVKGAAGGESMTSMMSGLGAAIDPVTLGITVATAELEVMIGVVIGAGVALAGLMAAAIGFNESARESTTRLTALTGDGKATKAMLDGIAASMGGAFNTSQLVPFATKLAAAGYQGRALEDAVRAVANATAIMGDEGGAAAQTMMARMQEATLAGTKFELSTRVLNQFAAMGVSATDIAKELGKSPEQLNKMSLKGAEVQKAIENILQAKGADALAEKAISLGQIMSNLQAGIASAFNSPEVMAATKEFMTALADLGSAFGKGSAGAGGLAGIIKGILVPAFHYASVAIVAIHFGISTLINWFLKAAIAFNQFKQTTIGAAVIKVAIAGIVGVMGALVAIVGIVGAVIGIVFLAAASVVAPVVAVVLGVASAFGAVAAGAYLLYGAVSSAIGGAIGYLSNLGKGATDAASNFIGGLVGGITAGTGAVVTAITGLASSAIGAFKDAMGIHSPSTVMKIQGQFMGAGVAQGMQESSAGVAQAANTMASASVGGAAQGGSKSSGSSGKSVSITLASGAIQISGVGSSGERLSP